MDDILASLNDLITSSCGLPMLSFELPISTCGIHLSLNSETLQFVSSERHRFSLLAEIDVGVVEMA